VGKDVLTTELHLGSIPGILWWKFWMAELISLHPATPSGITKLCPHLDGAGPLHLRGGGPDLWYQMRCDEYHGRAELGLAGGRARDHEDVCVCVCVCVCV